MAEAVEDLRCNDDAIPDELLADASPVGPAGSGRACQRELLSVSSMRTKWRPSQTS